MTLAVAGHDALNWPEVEALAKRLGVELSGQTRRLRITLDVNELVLIEHELYGIDAKREPRQDVVVTSANVIRTPPLPFELTAESQLCRACGKTGHLWCGRTDAAEIDAGDGPTIIQREENR